MKTTGFAFLLAAIAVGAAPPNVTSMARSARVFHQDAATKPVFADLLVAYEEPPAGTLPSAANAYLKTLMISVSKELYNSTGGAVQLGKVMIVPASIKTDPDILIMNDVASGCPGDIGKIEELPVAVCGDAHTGGYVGTAWWKATKLLGGKPVFETVDQSLKDGARVSVTWASVKNLGVPVLMHELGHYLFSMRDEYEGPVFSPDVDAFNGSASQDPRVADVGTGDKGYALAGSLGYVTALNGGAFLNKYNGYAMNLVSKYTPLTGYSPYSIDGTISTGPVPEAPVVFFGEDGYGVTEQIATVATRGNQSARRGGMWSLETTIRTALNSATYSLPTVKPTYDATQEDNITAFSNGQENIFVFDRSGSMIEMLSGDNPSSIIKSSVANDFFARMTHDEEMDPTVRYPATARFGFVSFDDQIEEPFGYPVPLQGPGGINDVTGLKGLTKKRASVFEGLAWESKVDATSGETLLPAPRGMTNLLGALETAKSRLDANLALPVQRNIMLITDGIHNDGTPYVPMTGDESKDGGYRLFAISVDSKLDGTDDYGTKLQKLASQSMGPDGLPGQAYWATGYTSTSSLADIANSIATSINKMDKTSFPTSTLYRDAAKEYTVQVDKTQTNGQFAIAWTGSVTPTLYLTQPDGQTLTEQNRPGITFRNTGNLKTIDIDLTKFPVPVGRSANSWKMRVTAPSLTNPITIIPSFSSKSTSRQIRVSFDPTNVRTDGRLPVSVVVQDGRPIEGLTVSAVFTNRATGVVRSFPLSWNGAAYVGTLAGNLQPGVNDLSVTVLHPNNGKVYFATGENRIPKANRTAYPYFASVTKSQQVWVAGAAAPKNIWGLSAVTLNSRPDNAQGTSLKLFLRNNTSYTWTGLKARYYYSVSEFPNGVPGVNVNYLAGGSKVTVGTVLRRPGLAYIEFDFAGKTLNPGDSTSFGSKGGEDVTLIESSWRSPWDPSNDWSAQGLKSTWTENGFVNIYDATGKLISGSADLDLPGKDGNAAPAVSITAPDLMSVGNQAWIYASTSDPENDPLTYAWTIDGSPISGNSSWIMHSFSTPGTYVLGVTVSDNHSNSKSATKNVVVQAANGACTEANSSELAVASANTTIPLGVGANCFVIRSPSLLREWKWANLMFQVNSDNGVALTGILEQNLLSGASTSLTGYSQTVAYSDPGVGKNVYIKLQASTARTVRLNWWLQ